MLNPSEIRHLCQTMGTMEEINPALLFALCEVESNYNQYAVRPEKAWSYFYPCNPEKEESKFKIFCHSVGAWWESEVYNQRQSWGLCQIMGSVARELGFKGTYLPQLTDPSLNLQYACKLLQRLARRYQNQDDVISAYNQGGPYKNEKGQYRNQLYVDKVKKAMKKGD